jgi:spermidine synthase
LVCEPLVSWCLQFKLAVGSLLASGLLFFVPLALLAMTGPFLVRVLTVSVSGVGGNVGRLTSISTLGSFAGTVLIGYVLIPFLPNSKTMYLTAVLLMGVVAGYYFFWRNPGRTRVTAVASMVAGLTAGYAAVWLEDHRGYPHHEVLARRNSNFGQMQVIEDADGQRSYLNDYLIQNTYDPFEGKSDSMFTYMLHELARAYNTNTSDVLCIGLGVGIVPMEFARDGARVDVVEINPAVVPLAQQYFDLEPEKLNITFGDGRQFVNQCRKQYDAIILDAFLGDSSPSHLMTKEAFTAMRRILKPSGVLVINCFAHFNPGTDFLGASLEKTLSSVFHSVRIHTEGEGANVFFVASERAEMEVLRAPDLEQVPSIVRGRTKAAFARIIQSNPNHGIVLTDNYNPVEFYDAANREELRKRLAGYAHAD